jgi:excisionase family DNA binding protein
MEQVFTIEEAADRLRCKPATVRRLIHHGRLRGHKIFGGKGQWRISESDLMEFIKHGGGPPSTHTAS